MKAVIMAGGTGTRLWPVSRVKVPKQVQMLGRQATLLQKTFQRLRRGWSEGDIFVSTSTSQLPAIQQQLRQLPQSQFIVEPVQRGTSAAMGLIATFFWKRNPKEVMFQANSDHFFGDEAKYIKAVKAGSRLLDRHPDRTVLFGVKPTIPHTGLGYIMMSGQAETVGDYQVFSVKRFIEKPDLKTARRFLTHWEYLWNMGSFMFRVDSMLEKYRRWLPKSYALLMQIAKDMGTSREVGTIKRLFPKMENIAIDYGIMEHDKHMLVIPLDLEWLDIGSWREVYDMLAKNRDANVALGRYIHIDSHGNLVYSQSDRLVATIGVQDSVIIETPDAILVCPRDRAQDVKKIVEQLTRGKLSQYL